MEKIVKSHCENLSCDPKNQSVYLLSGGPLLSGPSLSSDQKFITFLVKI